MTGAEPITDEEVARIRAAIERDAEAGAYHLNPDASFTGSLVRGLIENERRYGYRACPCRLAMGTREADLDIICPCDYRDADLVDFGACYCALYVSADVKAGRTKVGSIPERRLPRTEREKVRAGVPTSPGALGPLPLPVWRCTVCGYLCAREAPPLECPICKVGRERFTRFL